MKSVNVIDTRSNLVDYGLRLQTLMASLQNE
uniref:Uncharacterized protein n=1 Tax=Anguilla anguilla TaxID=7936 RepID=A0A0E9TZP1_ANGAN